MIAKFNYSNHTRAINTNIWHHDILNTRWAGVGGGGGGLVFVLKFTAILTSVKLKYV